MLDLRSKKTYSIVIINDTENRAYAAKKFLENEPGLNCEVIILEPQSCAALNQCMRKHAELKSPVAVIISDHMLDSGETGVEMALAAKKFKGTPPYVIIDTKWDTIPNEFEGNKTIDAVLIKGRSSGELLQAVKNGLKIFKQAEAGAQRSR